MARRSYRRHEVNGQLLDKLIKRANTYNSELAARAGISEGTIRNMLNGGNCEQEKIEAVVKALVESFGIQRLRVSDLYQGSGVELEDIIEINYFAESVAAPTLEANVAGMRDMLDLRWEEFISGELRDQPTNITQAIQHMQHSMLAISGTMLFFVGNSSDHGAKERLARQMEELMRIVNMVGQIIINQLRKGSIIVEVTMNEDDIIRMMAAFSEGHLDRTGLFRIDLTRLSPSLEAELDAIGQSGGDTVVRTESSMVSLIREQASEPVFDGSHVARTSKWRDKQAIAKGKRRFEPFRDSSPPPAPDMSIRRSRIPAVMLVFPVACCILLGYVLILRENVRVESASREAMRRQLEAARKGAEVARNALLASNRTAELAQRETRQLEQKIAAYESASSTWPPRELLLIGKLATEIDSSGIVFRLNNVGNDSYKGSVMRMKESLVFPVIAAVSESVQRNEENKITLTVSLDIKAPSYNEGMEYKWSQIYVITDAIRESNSIFRPLDGLPRFSLELIRDNDVVSVKLGEGRFECRVFK